MQPPRSNGSRTLLIVFGVIGLFLLCCCGGGGLLGYLGLQKGQATDGEAKAFAKTAVETVGRRWAPEDFARVASSTLDTEAESQQAQKYFSAWQRKLGPLKSLGEFTTAGMFFGAQNGLPPATRVRMSAPAKFEKGPGTILVVVAKAQGKWGIEKLDIQSDAILK